MKIQKNKNGGITQVALNISEAKSIFNQILIDKGYLLADKWELIFTYNEELNGHYKKTDSGFRDESRFSR